MTNELKPCPFCGGEAETHDGRGVQCSQCGARMQYTLDPEKIVSRAAWNTRPSGMVLVPEEPTFEMIEAGARTGISYDGKFSGAQKREAKRMYKARLKALQGKDG